MEEENLIIPFKSPTQYSISFIVPVYNVEKYLAECLESIIHQNIDKEIIIINDGSTDNSLSVAQDFAQKYNYIRIISQENKGVSYSRNLGVKFARGCYVCFVDSDDIIVESQISSLIQLADRYRIDIYKSAVKCFNHSRNETWNIENNINDIPQNHIKIISGIDYFRQHINGYWWPITWNGFYRTEFIRQYQLTFPIGLNNGEDIYFSICSFIQNPRILVSGEGNEFMLHRIRENSLSSSKQGKAIIDHDSVIKLLEEKLSEIQTQQKAYAENIYLPALFSEWKITNELSQYINQAIAFLYWISYEYYYRYLDEETKVQYHAYFPLEKIHFVKQCIGQRIEL